METGNNSENNSSNKYPNKSFAVAVKAIIKKDTSFLVLLKSESEEVNPNTYDIPGGRIEYGENPENAIHREVLEETNLTIEILTPINTWSFIKKDGVQLVGITYLCEYKSGKILLSKEHKSYSWMTKKEIIESHLPSWLVDEISNLD
jgi:8-oxo-dGTP diphosphatase